MYEYRVKARGESKGLTRRQEGEKGAKNDIYRPMAVHKSVPIGKRDIGAARGKFRLGMSKQEVCE
jgi:hypothetical protein